MNTTPMPLALTWMTSIVACSLLAAMLAGCGGKQSDSNNIVGDGLPIPAQEGGAVTGMPSKPGPGDVALSGQAPAPTDGAMLDPSDLFNPEAGLLASDGAMTTGETELASGNAGMTIEAATAVVHDYYAALNDRQYARAHALWADAGKASGQTLEQFTGGFSGTANITAQLGQPSIEEAGAGQRYVRIPVSVAMTNPDGNSRDFVGEYVLHRTVADGATAAQHQWRIATADLREVKPSP